MSAHPADLRTLHLAMLDAVLVGDGLGAVASLAARECGAPVAVVVPSLDVVAGSADAMPSLGRLRAYVADRCLGRSLTSVPPGVAAEAPIASGAELQGLVLLLGAGEVEVDERCLERLRLVAVAALTEIALARAAADAPGDAAAGGGVAASLLESLALGGAALSREEIVRGAARAGCDLRAGVVGVCCDLHVDRPHHVAALVRDDWPGALAECVTGSRLYALLPLAATGVSAPALAERLARHGPVGLSAACADPAGTGRTLESAALALDLAPAPGVPPWGVAAADPEAIRRHFDATLEPVLRYDRQYGTELVATLKRVLAGDTAAVAAGLGMPEHRVRYRLDKVRELSGCDAAAPGGRRALELGVRCLRVLRPSLRA